MHLGDAEQADFGLHPDSPSALTCDPRGYHALEDGQP